MNDNEEEYSHAANVSTRPRNVMSSLYLLQTCVTFIDIINAWLHWLEICDVNLLCLNAWPLFSLEQGSAIGL